tara:strand:- start:79 stop:867 length:789 start_codon:yes stop_codon:yes gene_type:complete
MKDYTKFFHLFPLFFIVFIFSCNTDHIDLDGGVAFTFDDDYVDDWFSLREFFLEYQVKATFFVSNFDKLEDREIVLLDTLQSDGHEIGCHGYRHIGIERDYDSDPSRISEYLQNEILPAIEVMNENGFHPVSFAYPFGHRNSYYDRALLKYFSHVRSTVYPDNSRSAKYTNEAFYSCPRDSGLVYALGIDSVFEIKRKHLKAALRRAMEDGKILILYAHRVGHQTNKYSVSIDDIKALIEIASELQLRFYTLSQMEHQCFAL